MPVEELGSSRKSWWTWPLVFLVLCAGGLFYSTFEVEVSVWIIDTLPFMRGFSARRLASHGHDALGAIHEVLADTLAAMKAAGIDGTVYSHPIGDHGHGAGGQLAAGTEQGRDHGRQESRIQAVICRQPGQLGIGHGLRYQHQGHRDAGDEVGPQGIRAADLPDPV